MDARPGDIIGYDYAWVVEDPNTPADTPNYWAGGGRFARNHMQAIRFAREEDAMRCAKSVFKGMFPRIVRHGWQRGLNRVQLEPDISLTECHQELGKAKRRIEELQKIIEGGRFDPQVEE